MDPTRAFKITFVVAATRNGVIGRGGDMPWRMPSSLRRFRSLTMGRPMIMGRKTFDAIGRPLDGRDSIVVTRDPAFKVDGVHRAASLADAFKMAVQLCAKRGTNEIIIAGGGEIYSSALPYATDVQLDLIETELEGDTVFTQLDPTAWQEIATQPIAPHPQDEYAATARVFRRIGPAKPPPSA
jgi:dihydrofolate reductase